LNYPTRFRERCVLSEGLTLCSARQAWRHNVP
jgi:hypothetical protein